MAQLQVGKNKRLHNLVVIYVEIRVGIQFDPISVSGYDPGLIGQWCVVLWRLSSGWRMYACPYCIHFLID